MLSVDRAGSAPQSAAGTAPRRARVGSIRAQWKGGSYYAVPCDKTTSPCFERCEAAGNLGSALGATGANAADLDCNGVVNNTDLNILRDAMGKPPGPSGEIPE